MIYDLPTSVSINGAEYKIRSDYRAVLDICIALADPELGDEEKAAVALVILYPDCDTIPYADRLEALKRGFWFIDCGNDGQNRPAPKLMNWEQDFSYIVAPVNRVIGGEIRAIPYLHWWTFVASYYEIGGECTFAQIVRIRNALVRGKKLDKEDRDWYRNNRELVDMKQKYSDSEEQLLKQWGGV